MKEKKACMFAFYSEATDGSKDDMLYVKERILDESGAEHVGFRPILNYEREFWVTKEGKRSTHSSKKEYEHIENLDVYRSTQARLPAAVARVLRLREPYHTHKTIKESPYVYGIDITTPSLIKYSYMVDWPDYFPKATVAALDLETNVHSTREEIIYGGVTFKDTAVLVVNGEWLGDVPDAEEQLQVLFTRYLGEYQKSRNITLHIKVVRNDLQVVRVLLKALHSMKPDLVSIWNMAFDIEKMLDALNYYKVDPADVFCDPSVEPRFRRFWWKKDNPQKTTATGKVTSKHPADLWHVVDAPASFCFVDSMCFFKTNRLKEQARHSYSLDNVLNEELKLGKLRFAEADAYDGLEWHRYMQKHYKLEYGIYNLFDCIALELLDEKTNDLSMSLLSGLGVSEPRSLKSNPRLLANELHFFLRQQGKIIGSTSANMTEEFDKLVLNMNDWILIMPSELVYRKGKTFVSDVGELQSKLYSHVFDIDISSGYPTVGVIMNVSKGTTLREVCGIEGISEKGLRKAGINLTALQTNAIELGQSLYGLPSMSKALKDFLSSE